MSDSDRDKSDESEEVVPASTQTLKAPASAPTSQSLA